MHSGDDEWIRVESWHEYPIRMDKSGNLPGCELVMSNMWDKLPHTDVKRIADLLVVESKRIGESWLSGTASRDEQNATTSFLAHIGALQFTVSSIGEEETVALLFPADQEEQAAEDVVEPVPLEQETQESSSVREPSNCETDSQPENAQKAAGIYVECQRLHDNNDDDYDDDDDDDDDYDDDDDDDDDDYEPPSVWLDQDSESNGSSVEPCETASCSEVDPSKSVQQHPCSNLGKIPPSTLELDKHLRLRLKEGSEKAKAIVYNCDLCTLSFKLESSMLRHLKRCHGISAADCKARLPDLQGIVQPERARMPLKSAAKSQREQAKSKNDGSPPIVYNCDLCTHSFTRKSAVVCHLTRDHAVPTADCEARLSDLQGTVRQKKSTRPPAYFKNDGSPPIIYNCDQCATSFKTKNGTLRHLNQRHGIPTVDCEARLPDLEGTVRQKRSTRPLSYFKNDGSPPIIYNCDQCATSFKTKNGTVRHLNRRHGIPTVDCEARLPDLQGTVRQERYQKRRRGIPTVDCEAGLPDLEGTVRRKRSTRPPAYFKNDGSPPIVYNCDLCATSFKTKNWTLRHLNRRHGIPTVDCEARLPDLEGTVRQKRSTRPLSYFKNDGSPPIVYNCDHCTASFKTKNGTLRHLNRRHGIPTVDCEARLPDLQGTVRQERYRKRLKLTYLKSKAVYACDICPATFKRRVSLKEHINSKHTKQDKFPCEVCGKHMFSSRMLKEHMRIHGEATLKCTECEMAFRYKGLLRRHQRNNHGNNLSLCEVCGAQFKNEDGFKYHMKIVHSNTYGFPCTICKRQFKVASKLNVHMRTHTDKRPFPCELCDKSFRTRINRQVHMDWHNNIRRHKCEFCAKCFLTKGNLLKHRVVHTRHARYSCSECDRRLTDYTMLRKHMAEKHEIVLEKKYDRNPEKIRPDSTLPTIAPTDDATPCGESQKEVQSAELEGVVTQCHTELSPVTRAHEGNVTVMVEQSNTLDIMAQAMLGMMVADA